MSHLFWKKKHYKDITIYIKDKTHFPRAIRHDILRATDEALDQFFSNADPHFDNLELEYHRTVPKKGYEEWLAELFENESSPAAGFFPLPFLERGKKRIILCIDIIVKYALIGMKKGPETEPRVFSSQQFKNEFIPRVQKALLHESSHLKHAIENPSRLKDRALRKKRREKIYLHTKSDLKVAYDSLLSVIEDFFENIIAEGVAHYYNIANQKLMRQTILNYYPSLKRDLQDIQKMLLECNPDEFPQVFEKFRKKTIDELSYHAYRVVQLTKNPKTLSKKEYYHTYEKTCIERLKVQPLLSLSSRRGVLDFRHFTKEIKRRGRKEVHKL